jgi:cytidylate kinase
MEIGNTGGNPVAIKEGKMAVITISRQYGSGGTEIALLVCELLAYQLVDKEIIARAVEEVGLTTGEVVGFTEHHSKMRMFVDRLLYPGPNVVAEVAVRSFGEGKETLAIEELDKAEALNLVRSAIHAGYKNGDAVILGRGGQAILQDMPGVLHVRIVAPMKDRVLRIQGRAHIDMERAHQLALRRDRKRFDYLRDLFDVDINEPTLYHMVLNTGKLGVDDAAQMIVHAASLLKPSPQPF